MQGKIRFICYAWQKAQLTDISHHYIALRKII